MSVEIEQNPSAIDPRLALALRALADLDRMRIILAINAQGLSVRDLSESLGLTPDVIGKHLQILGRAGLLVSTSHGRERSYLLRSDTLTALLCDLEKIQTPVQVPGMTPVAARFFHGDRLITYPSSRSKQRAVLAVLANDFARDHSYTEVEVNTILIRRNPDCATLRRALVDEGVMTRASGIYRRI